MRSLMRDSESCTGFQIGTTAIAERIKRKLHGAVRVVKERMKVKDTDAPNRHPRVGSERTLVI